MTQYRILSWNVNGIRAVSGKEIVSGLNFSGFLTSDAPDICCLQETKADAKSLTSDISRIGDYFFFLNPAEKKGYSGVGLYTRKEPTEISYGFGSGEFNHEGRTIIARYPEFLLYAIYFPNGGASADRLAFKLKFYEAFLQHIKEMDAAGENIVICGDVNTAHHPIDLARPKENETVSGFLPVEREWLDRLIAAGFLDTFREFNQEAGQYTWWDYKTRARSRNVGWRIDYFFINSRLRNHLISSTIRSEIMGSDHCPVEIVLQFD